MKQPSISQWTLILIFLFLLSAVALLKALPGGSLAWIPKLGFNNYKEIASFPEPKEFPPEPSPEPGCPDDLRWTLPTGWKQVSPPPGRGGFRAAAAIQVLPDDSKLLLTISKLPNQGSELQMNIARWSELFLHMAPPQDTDKVVTHHQNGDVASDVIDMSNPASPPLRLLAALVPHGGETWAFKISGPADVIAGQKDRFDAFIASLHFAAAPAPAIAEEAPQVPAPSGATDGVEGLRWKLPAGWTAEAGAPGGFRVATIHPGGNGDMEIKVSRLGSNAGGLAANVNRWRGEVGLDPVSADQADPGEQRTIGETTLTLHAYTGPARGGTREVVAAADVAGSTWYFKLLGPTDSVTAQQAAFDEFLKSLKFAP